MPELLFLSISAEKLQTSFVSGVGRWHPGEGLHGNICHGEEPPG